MSVSERARDDCNIGGGEAKEKGRKEKGEGERRETLTKEYRRSRSLAKSREERDQRGGEAR